MKLLITANPEKPRALAVVRKAVELLADRTEIVVVEETAKKMGLSVPTTPLEGASADVLIAVGGDGTFLSALQRSPLPLLAINAGTFGFLAEVDGSQAPELQVAVDRLLSGDYFLEERMKLATQIAGEVLPDATNEVVVHTAQVTKMRHFELAVDGTPVGRLRADGVIVATPTGSTSYALSALGPIIDPGVEAVVVTALAPFQATQRAVVIDPLRTVSVRLLPKEKDGIVVVDGQSEVRIPAGTTVVLHRSPRKAIFVRFAAGFFRRLSGKKILPWSEELAEGSENRADLSPPT